MWTSKQRVVGLSLGLVVLLTVFMAFAQDETNEPKACSSTKVTACCASGKTTTCKAQAGTAACMGSSGCGSCTLVRQMPVYMDGPGALLAQATKLELTDEQKASLNKILAQARIEAVAVLTDEQRAQLGEVSDQPVMACQAGIKEACGPGCTKPCCADEAKTCPVGCIKPCCADKDAAVEQTVCPVMGLPINKNLYSEYQGKKVYYCCPGCKAKFEADPQKYLVKLPQFKQ